MKLKYKAQKRSRIKTRFMGFTTFEPNWWFHYSTNQWEFDSDTKGGCSSHQKCRSVKAFKRMLKNCPKGVEFILCSRYKGHTVIGYGTK